MNGPNSYLSILSSGMLVVPNHYHYYRTRRSIQLYDDEDNSSVNSTDLDRDEAETQEYLEFLRDTRTANVNTVTGAPEDLSLTNYASRAQEHLEDMIRNGNPMRISNRESMMLVN